MPGYKDIAGSLAQKVSHLFWFMVEQAPGLLGQCAVVLICVACESEMRNVDRQLQTLRRCTGVRDFDITCVAGCVDTDDIENGLKEIKERSCKHGCKPIVTPATNWAE